MLERRVSGMAESAWEVGWDADMQDGGCQEGRGQDVKRSGAVGCGSAPPQDPEWIRREKEGEGKRGRYLQRFKPCAAGK